MYRAQFPWGDALLKLDSDNTFRESIYPKAGKPEELTGKWTLDSKWPARVSLAPYWELTSDGAKGKSSSSYLAIESRGIRSVHIYLASYGSQGFEKQ
jgi:hypothetical protein